VGAVVPHVRVHVIRTDSTIIGGTGLCCWYRNLDHVVFGGHQDQYGLPIGAAAQVYVTAAGRVIQANVIPQGVNHYPLPARCVDRTHADSRQVLVGHVCFSYPAMAGILWTVHLGGHQPYLVGPGWFATVAALGARLARTPDQVHLHLVFRSADHVVYTVSKGSITYRFTQVAAFPGLRGAGSSWPLVDTQRIH
jgi:hypothetical protein